METKRDPGFTVRLEPLARRAMLEVEGGLSTERGKRVTHTEAIAALLDFYQRYRPAVRLVEQGKSVKAAVEALGVLQSDSECWRAYAALLDAGRVQEAMAVAKAAAKDPAVRESVLMSIAAQNDGALETAEKHLKKALERAREQAA